MTIFTEREISLLDTVTRIVAKLPEEGPNGPLRCHEVARVVGRLLGLTVEDGFYGFADHSWLWTEKPDPSKIVTSRVGMPNILDPYCVGSLPVVRLLDGSCTALPHVGWSYRSGPPRMDIDEDLVDSLIRKLGF
ncbi:MAG: hypothetical protein BWY99_02867 [Synergistetes bacterium ADurb.BinA166]|nr:MAG: hypothetical protein BWY99_02867 [Synergistetes bacterium ADurb.BinA166]